jgi:hypothetical protein
MRLKGVRNHLLPTVITVCRNTFLKCNGFLDLLTSGKGASQGKVLNNIINRNKNQARQKLSTRLKGVRNHLLPAAIIACNNAVSKCNGFLDLLTSAKGDSHGKVLNNLIN